MREENEQIVKKITQHFSRYKEISKEMALTILGKHNTARTDVENRIVADYLSLNFEYFKKIKETNQKKFLKLISVLGFETYLPNELIINVNFEEDKFFVVFEGSVQAYRQNFYEKEIRLGDFCDYLFYIKKKDEKHYLRLLKKNRHLGINFEEVVDNPYYYKFQYKKFIFNIEELEEIGKFGEGYVFGEMNLIRKKKSDVLIKALIKTDVISVSKFDFNRILKTIEEKRLEIQSERFKKKFSMFKFWSMEQIITLFNYCSYIVFHKDEYIYKQNETSHYIFFIEKGKFEQYCNTSFSWYKNFIEYIGNLNENLINIIIVKKPENNKKLREIYEEEMKKQENKDKLISSKKIEDLKFLNIEDIYLEKKKPLDKYEKTDNLFYIKKEEDELNDSNKIIKIPLLTSEMPRVLGMEEPFELKRRFSSVKCLSGKVVAKKINVYDLLKLLLLYKEFKYSEDFLNLLVQKKIVLINTIKMHLKKNAQKFEKNIKAHYEELISQNDNISKKIATAKLKGWNNGLYIDNILDTSLHLFKPKPESIVNKQKEEIDNMVNNLLNKIPDKNAKKTNKTFLNLSKNNTRQPFLVTERREMIRKKENSEDTMKNKIRSVKNVINTYSNKKIINNIYTEKLKKINEEIEKCDIEKKIKRRSLIDKKILINNINSEMRNIVMNKILTPRNSGETFDEESSLYFTLKVNKIKNKNNRFNNSKSNKSNNMLSFSRTFYSNSLNKSYKDKNIRKDTSNSYIANKVESFCNNKDNKDSFSKEKNNKMKGLYIFPSINLNSNKNNFQDGKRIFNLNNCK